jgi:hypothetical protein
LGLLPGVCCEMRLAGRFVGVAEVTEADGFVGAGIDLPGQCQRLLADPLIVVTDPDGLDTLRPPASVRVLIMPDNEVAEVFAVRGRPFAVAVDADGVVKTKRGLNTVAQLSDLIASVVPQEIPVSALVSDTP